MNIDMNGKALGPDDLLQHARDLYQGLHTKYVILSVEHERLKSEIELHKSNVKQLVKIAVMKDHQIARLEADVSAIEDEKINALEEAGNAICQAEDGESLADAAQRVMRDIRRALDAWDSTVLEQSRDGRLQEAMECLREVLTRMLEKRQFTRLPEQDRRFANGDDFAGDAWRDEATGQIAYSVVGGDMNRDIRRNNG